MAGKLYPKDTLFMSIEAGAASSDERSYALLHCMISGAPIIESKQTGIWWSIKWTELLSLAVAAGIDGEEQALDAPETVSALSAAARDVLAERRRQIEAEGWSPEHDDEHSENEMALAAACYAMSAGGYAKGKVPPVWPLMKEWWKPSTPRRDLVKAGALILAEIERLDRAGSEIAAAIALAEEYEQ